MIDLIKNQILESIEVKKNLLDTSLSDIEQAVSLMITSIRNKGKILWTCTISGVSISDNFLSKIFIDLFE